MIRVDGTQVKAFSDQLRGVPRELQKELRPAVRRAGQALLQDVKRRSAWSSRIPQATKLFVGFGPRSSGVQLRVNSRQAPHARPFEFGSSRNEGQGILRHPVFGGDAWVSQPTRPFVIPAVRANADETVREIQKAIDQTLGRL